MICFSILFILQYIIGYAFEEIIRNVSISNSMQAYHYIKSEYFRVYTSCHISKSEGKTLDLEQIMMVNRLTHKKNFF
jgi:hypothetical protein